MFAVKRIGSFIFMIHKQQYVLHMIIIIFVNYNNYDYKYTYLFVVKLYRITLFMWVCYSKTILKKRITIEKKRVSFTFTQCPGSLFCLGKKIAARYLFDLSLESINGFSRVMQKLCPPFQKARVNASFQLARPFLVDTGEVVAMEIIETWCSYCNGTYDPFKSHHCVTVSAKNSANPMRLLSAGWTISTA